MLEGTDIKYSISISVPMLGENAHDSLAFESKQLWDVTCVRGPLRCHELLG